MNIFHFVKYFYCLSKYSLKYYYAIELAINEVHGKIVVACEHEVGSLQSISLILSAEKIMMNQDTYYNNLSPVTGADGISGLEGDCLRSTESIHLFINFL